VLTQVAEGVLVHESAFCQSHAVVVVGHAGVLLVDAGVTEAETVCLAGDLADAGHTVALGFSTHPHWDHLLWHPALGSAPRHGTARCAATAQQRLSAPGAKERVASMIPPIGPSAEPGWEWVRQVHEGQATRLADLRASS
jgi:glyoxylase-like metal-dependent hydrolase (beta-lactamase superfamily II)